MKKKMAIMLLLAMFLLIGIANATDNIHINAQVQDKYLISETQQLQSTIST